jgi:hypothetical protein
MTQKEASKRYPFLHKPVTWFVTVALLGLGIGLGVALPNRRQSPPRIELAHLLTATSSENTCGSWATDPTDPTEVSITEAAGLILSCDLVAYTWVVVTEGTTNPPANTAIDPPTHGATYSVIGAVLTYACSAADATCLDPATPHPFSSWTITHYPQPEYFKPTVLFTPTDILGLTLGAWVTNS